MCKHCKNALILQTIPEFGILYPLSLEVGSYQDILSDIYNISENL